MDLGGIRLFVAVKASTNQNILVFPPGFDSPDLAGAIQIRNGVNPIQLIQKTKLWKLWTISPKDMHLSMKKDQLQDSQLKVQTIMTRSAFIHKYNGNI